MLIHLNQILSQFGPFIKILHTAPIIIKLKIILR